VLFLWFIALLKAHAQIFTKKTKKKNEFTIEF